MSDEIAQDDDGKFEIGDIGVPDDFDDDDDDDEAQVGKDAPHAPPVTGITAGPGTAATSSAQPRDQGRSMPRESLEGETIFAVGEDGDKFSDDGSDEEDAKLVHSSK